jgi:hypothetical protein
MPDKPKKDQTEPFEFDYRLKVPKPEFRLTEQRLQLYPTYPSFWLSPIDFQLGNIGYTQILKIIGKSIDVGDRKSFLWQTSPEEIPKIPSTISVSTDATPDLFTNNNQVAVGVQGFGFNSKGNIFLQASSDRPHSNYYNSLQLNVIPGDIPLVVFHNNLSNVSLTPQLGVDLQSGQLSPSAKINFGNSILKSINLQTNNLSFDWKKKFADSVTVSFEIALPNFL